MWYIFFLAFAFSMLSANAQKSELFVVYNAVNKHFSIKGQDFPMSDAPFSIGIGDLLAIKNERKNPLPGGSYRWIFLISDPKTNKQYRFYSRIINTGKTALIKQATKIKQEVQGKDKWLDGFHPVVEYAIELEDGAKYEVKYTHDVLNGKWHAYKKQEQATAAVKEMVIKPGDTIVFKQSSPIDHYIVRYEVDVYDQNKKQKAGQMSITGPKREENKPVLPDNQFKVKTAQMMRFGGLVIRNEPAVEFEEFSPWQAFYLEDIGYLGKIAKEGVLKFISKENVKEEDDENRGHIAYVFSLPSDPTTRIFLSALGRLGR